MGLCRVDDKWHHIAVTWEYSTGIVRLYFDGDEYTPFWRASEGMVRDKNPNKGGVDPSIGRGVERLPTGSLVLGQVCWDNAFAEVVVEINYKYAYTAVAKDTDSCFKTC